MAWSSVVPQPSTADVRSALEPFLALKTAERTSTESSPARPERGTPSAVGTPGLIAVTLRRALSDLHEDILIKLNGADARQGSAYGLGRALADTMRTKQSAEDLTRNFAPYRLGQLYTWLSDLASALPPHAAKSVRRSLTWWRDTLYSNPATPLGVDRNLLNGVHSDAPGLLSRRRATTRVISALRPGNRGGLIITTQTTLSATDESDLATCTNALQRQGELWRSVLTGEKQATDLLTAADYISAGQQTLTLFWRLVARARGLLIPAALLAAGLIAFMIAISATNASGDIKVGGFLGAAIAYLVATAKALGPRLSSLAQKLEEPLWGDTLDLVIAHAITLPPAGTADSAGWLSFVEQGLDTPLDKHEPN